MLARGMGRHGGGGRTWGRQHSKPAAATDAKAMHAMMPLMGTGTACQRRDGDRGRKPVIGGPHFTIKAPPAQ